MSETWKCPDCGTEYVRDVGRCGDLTGCSQPQVVRVLGRHREINRWECPNCYAYADTPEDDSQCCCGYQGGYVQVWYVPKEEAVRYERALRKVVSVLTSGFPHAQKRTLALETCRRAFEEARSGFPDVQSTSELEGQPAQEHVGGFG